MKIIQNLIILCILCLGYALSGAQVFAQSGGVSIVLNPEFPQPGESIVISLSSLIENLNQAQIRWMHEGVVLREGVGVTQITFSTQTNTTVTVSYTPPGGSLITRNIPINVEGVDLLWQVSNSYVPPFYKGKALPTQENSVIEFVAIPTVGNPQNPVYTWSLNGDVEQSASGVGRNVFTLVSSPLVASVQNVGVRLASAGVQTGAQQNISFVSPEVVFYEIDSRLGRYMSRVLKNNQTISVRDMTIEAIPFFLSVPDIFQDIIQMEWEVNRQSVVSSGSKNRLRFSVPAGQTGALQISLGVNNTARLFENGRVFLNLNVIN